MDYDATDIAVAYDRGRDHGFEVLRLWMNVVSSYVTDQCVLNAACPRHLNSDVERTRRREEQLHPYCVSRSDYRMGWNGVASESGCPLTRRTTMPVMVILLQPITRVPGQLVYEEKLLRK
jgi:hypothetical protein